MVVELDNITRGELLKQLSENKDEVKVKLSADLVLATWFNDILEIELADRDKYEVKSEVITCEKYDSGNVKLCVIDYYFQEII